MFSVQRKHINVETSDLLKSGVSRFLASRENFDYMFNVYFNKNGAESISYDSKSYAIGANFGSFPTALKSGYKNIGYSYSQSDSSNLILSSDQVDITRTQTYAQFVQLIDHMFDADGGYFSDGTQTKTRQFAPGYPFQEYGFPTDPTKTDLKFKGWYTQLSGQGMKIEGTTLSPTTSTTYYAYWKKSSGTMVYCGNYGSYSQTDVVLGEVIDGSVEEGVVTVQCNGSSYIGGYSDTVEFDFNNQTVSIGSGYQWNQYATYSLNWYGVSDFDIYVRVIE